MSVARLVLALTALLAARSSLAALDEAMAIRTPAGDAARCAQSIDAFACALHRRFAAQPGNLLISPHSLSTALSMAMAGARGETRAEMAKTLGFAADGTTADADQLALAQALARDAQAAKAELHVANAIWGARDVAWAPGYLPLCRDQYQGGLSILDFADEPAARTAINGWVAERTAKRITDLIGEGVLTRDTRLVLTNAVYLRAAWDDPFEAAFTKEGPFAAPTGAVQAKLMHGGGYMPFLEKDGVRLAALPYAGRQFELLLLLPTDPAPAALRTLEASLDAEHLSAWRDSAKSALLSLTLPRFTVATPVLHLVDDLRALGMHRAVDAQQADFSGMAHEPLFIGAVEHKAFIAVDEQGTEAAAATAVEMAAGCVPPKPIEFTCDRPFLYLLRHVPTGAILFSGRLVDPTVR